MSRGQTDLLARRVAAADSTHSTRVRQMKKVLLAVTGALILAVVVLTENANTTSYIRLDAAAETTTESDVLRLVNPRVQGIDDNNQPYNISAKSARQKHADSPNIELKGVTAAVKQGDHSVTISSGAATVDRRTREVNLDGHVAVGHQGGYALSTDAITVDTQKGTARSDNPVQGATPAGTVDAAGLEISNFGERLLFKGRSAVTVDPNAAEATSPLRQDVPLR